MPASSATTSRSTWTATSITRSARKRENRFFALESTYLVPEQVAWLEKELKASGSHWEIAVVDHPLYPSGERHGPDVKPREALEPFFVKDNVSVALQGHYDFYERVKLHKDIPYFVVGSGGMLRAGNIDPELRHHRDGFDIYLAFMVAEIDGDQMHFTGSHARDRPSIRV